MSRSLYSLILSDEVVAAVDREALRQNTNRSNMVNLILAQYVSYTTPEMTIDNIFRGIEQLLSLEEELVPFIEPNQRSMSVKSSLAYKYRPTIKYEIELYRAPGDVIGELQATFRTTSQPLLQVITRFFSEFCKLENKYIGKYYKKDALQYSLCDGKFTRTIPHRANSDYTNEQLSRELSSYVSMFDTLLKGYVTGRLNDESLEEKYLEYLKSGIGII